MRVDESEIEDDMIKKAASESPQRVAVLYLEGQSGDNGTDQRVKSVVRGNERSWRG